MVKGIGGMPEFPFLRSCSKGILQTIQKYLQSILLESSSHHTLKYLLLYLYDSYVQYLLIIKKNWFQKEKQQALLNRYVKVKITF
jgi:hypothetical protein